MVLFGPVGGDWRNNWTRKIKNQQKCFSRERRGTASFFGGSWVSAGARDGSKLQALPIFCFKKKNKILKQLPPPHPPLHRTHFCYTPPPLAWNSPNVTFLPSNFQVWWSWARVRSFIWLGTTRGTTRADGDQIESRFQSQNLFCLKKKFQKWFAWTVSYSGGHCCCPAATIRRGKQVCRTCWWLLTTYLTWAYLLGRRRALILLRSGPCRVTLGTRHGPSYLHIYTVFTCNKQVNVISASSLFLFIVCVTSLHILMRRGASGRTRDRLSHHCSRDLPNFYSDAFSFFEIFQSGHQADT